MRRKTQIFNAPTFPQSENEEPGRGKKEKGDNPLKQYLFHGDPPVWYRTLKRKYPLYEERLYCRGERQIWQILSLKMEFCFWRVIMKGKKGSHGEALSADLFLMDCRECEGPSLLLRSLRVVREFLSSSRRSMAWLLPALSVEGPAERLLLSAPKRQGLHGVLRSVSIIGRRLPAVPCPGRETVPRSPSERSSVSPHTTRPPVDVMTRSVR